MGPSPLTGPLPRMPTLFPDSDQEDDGHDDFGPPGLLLSQPVVESRLHAGVSPEILPPNVLHRLAWRTSNPSDALRNLRGTTLHEPMSDVDFSNVDSGSATAQTVSMVTPPGGIAHVVADEVHTSSDRRSATAHGPNARGLSLAPESGSLALVWLEGGEAHCELSAMDDDPPAPLPAAEPRRSARTRTHSLVCAAPPSPPVASTSRSASSTTVTAPRARASLRTTARMSTGGKALSKWVDALKYPSNDEVEAAQLQRLTKTSLRNCTKIVVAEAADWGRGLLKLMDLFCVFSSSAFPDAPLPYCAERPAQMNVFITRNRCLMPSVVSSCDNTFGVSFRNWWLALQPQQREPLLGNIPSHVDWTPIACGGSKGLSLVIAGLLMWRREMAIINKESNKDLRPWAEMIIDVTMVLERILLDLALSSSDNDDPRGASVSKRHKSLAPPSDDEMPDVQPTSTAVRAKSAARVKRTRRTTRPGR
jgi:hypothetical protein